MKDAKKERQEQRMTMIPELSGERILVNGKAVSGEQKRARRSPAARCPLPAHRHEYHHAAGSGRLRLRLTVRSTTLELTSATPLALSNLSSRKAEKWSRSATNTCSK